MYKTYLVGFAALVLVALGAVLTPSSIASAASSCTLNAYTYGTSKPVSQVSSGTKITLVAYGPSGATAGSIDNGVGQLTLTRFFTSVYAFVYPTVFNTTTYTATFTTSQGPVTCSTTVSVQGSTTPQSCTFNSQAIADGASVTAYNTTSVSSPDTCTAHSETRTCTNGMLSGSYTNAACTVSGGTTTTTHITASASRSYPRERPLSYTGWRYINRLELGCLSSAVD